MSRYLSSQPKLRCFLHEPWIHQLILTHEILMGYSGFPFHGLYVIITTMAAKKKKFRASSPISIEVHDVPTIRFWRCHHLPSNEANQVVVVTEVPSSFRSRRFSSWKRPVSRWLGSQLNQIMSYENGSSLFHDGRLIIEKLFFDFKKKTPKSCGHAFSR